AGEERLEQLLACALAAPARDDRDRQLRRLLVDESEARLVLGEEPVPRSAVLVWPFERDHPRVALAPPVLHVAVDRALGVLREPPVIRVPEHVAKEADVVDPDRPEHQSSCASWTRFPSGS